MVAFSQGAEALSFFRVVRVPGRTYGSGLSVASSTEEYRPSSSAAAATTSLKVEPGGSGCRSARLISGCFLSADRSFHAFWSPLPEPANLPGSYEGVLTIPRILPVAGSRATAAPVLFPSAS